MRFYSFDLDHDPLTLVFKLDLDIVKLLCVLKMKFLTSVVLTDTHRQTDRHD